MKVKEIILCKLFVKLLKLMIQNYKLVLWLFSKNHVIILSVYVTLYGKGIIWINHFWYASADEKVSCMAVEFWSTVCEEELEIALQKHELGLDSLQAAQNPDLITFNFALIASGEVLPTLLTLLTRQNEDPEDDDWSVAMAAGACLQLFAQNIGNYVVEPTIHFVGSNLANKEN